MLHNMYTAYVFVQKLPSWAHLNTCMAYITPVLILECFLQDCPENPECLVFQECAICETFPNGLNYSDVNCTAQRVGSVDTATYRIDGSKCMNNCLCHTK